LHKAFKTVKSGGFNFEDTHLTDPKQIDKCIALVCLWWDTVRHEVIKKTSRLVCLGELIPDPETSVLIDSLHRVYPHYP